MPLGCLGSTASLRVDSAKSGGRGQLVTTPCEVCIPEYGRWPLPAPQQGTMRLWFVCVLVFFGAHAAWCACVGVLCDEDEKIMEHARTQAEIVVFSTVILRKFRLLACRFSDQLQTTNVSAA